MDMITMDDTLHPIRPIMHASSISIRIVDRSLRSWETILSNNQHEIDDYPANVSLTFPACKCPKIIFGREAIYVAKVLEKSIAFRYFPVLIECRNGTDEKNDVAWIIK